MSMNDVMNVTMDSSGLSPTAAARRLGRRVRTRSLPVANGALYQVELRAHHREWEKWQALPETIVILSESEIRKR